jgi:hypothetical protein
MVKVSARTDQTVCVGGCRSLPDFAGRCRRFSAEKKTVCVGCCRSLPDFAGRCRRFSFEKTPFVSVVAAHCQALPAVAVPCRVAEMFSLPGWIASKGHRWNAGLPLVSIRTFAGQNFKVRCDRASTK